MRPGKRLREWFGMGLICVSLDSFGLSGYRAVPRQKEKYDTYLETPTYILFPRVWKNMFILAFCTISSKQVTYAKAEGKKNSQSPTKLVVDIYCPPR